MIKSIFKWPKRLNLEYFMPLRSLQMVFASVNIFSLNIQINLECALK